MTVLVVLAAGAASIEPFGRVRAPVHGTNYRYNNRGCRCGICRKANTMRKKAERLARMATGNLTHGTRAGYDAGCRCEPCSQARRDAYLRLPSEQKDPYARALAERRLTQ